MSAASVPAPQFLIPTTAVASLTTAVSSQVLSVALEAGKYYVSGVINMSSTTGVILAYSISAPLIDATNPIASMNFGAADDFTDANIPINFIFVSTGTAAPLVITLNTTFASGTTSSAVRQIRFNRSTI